MKRLKYLHVMCILRNILLFIHSSGMYMNLISIFFCAKQGRCSMHCWKSRIEISFIWQRKYFESWIRQPIKPSGCNAAVRLIRWSSYIAVYTLIHELNAFIIVTTFIKKTLITLQLLYCHVCATIGSQSTALRCDLIGQT